MPGFIEGRTWEYATQLPIPSHDEFFARRRLPWNHRRSRVPFYYLPNDLFHPECHGNLRVHYDLLNGFYGTIRARTTWQFVHELHRPSFVLDCLLAIFSMEAREILVVVDNGANGRRRPKNARFVSRISWNVATAALIYCANARRAGKTLSAGSKNSGLSTNWGNRGTEEHSPYCGTSLKLIVSSDMEKNTKVMK
ncbi:unnamed protein product [Nippostrongylus brasiliensis]|uniref:Uncharacterized protein n=1 Tax=Nippostrongylus brasiliensis TaxID=27835 RepID=A0A0N4YP56_NIPBR|nr:unnamed protein product [Nippostrongylus brasiliensis]